ncbi:MAG TPA: SIMPL domain-containing protein [Candidatus Binataceae bacterium]|nr:SIMPL domain-containing protein [Candidatus Binataceae bacterium]
MNRKRFAAVMFSLMMMLSAMPALAADQTRVIEVSGAGEARSAPDVANLNLQIETRAATAQEASSKNATLAQSVTQVLKDKLAGKGIVQTGDYSLNPDYSQPGPNGHQKVIGYVAQNTVTVETGEMTLLGALIDSAIAAGANRINYLNFGLRDDTKAREQAIANASKDAQAQAQALAASLNVKLKDVIKASTVQERPPIVPMSRVALMSAKVEASTPIEASQISVSATVMLTYEIE